ncbi:TolB-like 6-bladed beta-propeller domain-containing protein [Aquiflexum sp. TKW24L]|nr:TolB-like 6-bladed beta-propeller domain-containing protein [Aquiflexum sp. TKW24L]
MKDNLALVWESKYAKDKFHVIDMETETYLQTKGIDGLGPGEITMIYSMDDLGEKNKIWTYDLEQFIFSKYDLLDTNKLAENQFRAPKIEYFITEPTWSSDSTLLVNLVDGWEKYLHIKLNGDTLAQFGNWKDNIKGKELPQGLKEEELDANVVSSLFQGSLMASKNRNYFIKVGTNVDFIEIIDLNKKTIKPIYGPKQELPEFKYSYDQGYQMLSLIPPIELQYRDAFAGIDSFFVLYFGKDSKKISEPDNLNRIFEFDYEGNLLNHYQLDYPLIGFTVDENSRRIYGVSFDQDPNIVRFDY